MRAFYFDASAFMKTVLAEPESRALRKYMVARPSRKFSSSLLRAEALRSVRHLGPAPLGRVREQLLHDDLVSVDDRILETAGLLEPRVLRTLDAIHLATALTAGEDLEAIVTYDARMVDGAALLGLKAVSPR